MSGRNFGDLFTCTEALKVWLPETVESQLGEVSCFLNISISDLIRQILFIHLYGRYDFLGYVERSLHHFKDPQTVVSKAMFSLLDDDVPDNECSLPGKKQESEPAPEPLKEKQIAATKVFLPERMKNDLLALAAKKIQPVSEYCRQVIITHLHGHQGTFSETPAGVYEGIE